MTAGPGTTTSITTDTGALHVSTVGAGPPALLWHSMSIDSSQRSRVQDRLGAHRTLVLVDGPGHGRSARPPRGIDLDTCADAAGQVLDALGLVDVDWLGNAWGGHVGIAFAARYPHRVRTLTAVAAPITPLPPAQRRRIALLATAYGVVGAARPLRSAVAGSLLGSATRAEDPAAVRLLTDAFAAPERTGMHRMMTAMMLDRPDLSDRLPRITAPTLFVTGTEDPIWPPARAAAEASVVARGRSVALSGTGHLPPVESPESFVEEVLRFWSGPSSSAVDKL